MGVVPESGTDTETETEIWNLEFGIWNSEVGFRSRAQLEVLIRARARFRIRIPTSSLGSSELEFDTYTC